MEAKDLIWRLLDRLAEEKRVFAESYSLVDPKIHKDLQQAILECEQLINTQQNILRRIQRKYDP